jgi:CheY-like chemotaxis protein
MLKALVVEDEKDIKQLLLEELEDRGYQVLEADNGESAMQIVNEQTPDIIFVDVYMPVMDGLNLITRLKREPDTSSIPVILVTVMNAMDTEENVRKLGVEYFITKPWERCELDAALDSIFKLSGLSV